VLGLHGIYNDNIGYLRLTPGMPCLMLKI
jgi:hypothetical protein